MPAFQLIKPEFRHPKPRIASPRPKEESIPGKFRRNCLETRPPARTSKKLFIFIRPGHRKRISRNQGIP